MQQFLFERIRHRSPFAYVLLVFSYVTTSKISLIYVQGYEKRNPTQIHKHGPKIRSENLNSRNLDRYLNKQNMLSLIKPRQIAICRAVVELFVRTCRAICPALVNSFSSLVSWYNLHDFNTRLELLFFEVLNTSQIYPITSKVHFVKGLTKLHKMLTYIPNIESHSS